MKCAREKCPYQAKQDRVYCSPDCARLERAEENSGSETDSSSLEDAGEQSEESSSDELSQEQSSLSEKQTQNTSKSSEIVSEGNTRTEERRNSEGINSITGSELTRRENSFPLSEDSGADGLTRLAASLKPSENSSAETSHSMSLIDKSATHLHDLMKSVAPSQTTEPEKIKSACEAAKQMTQLLRLKLDILREFRKT
jgi:hypothetical protein